MDVLLALLHVAAYLLLALSLWRPDLARVAVPVALAAAVGSVLHGVLGPERRELVTEHLFVAYAGSELEPSAYGFPTGTMAAPGWQWPLPFVAFVLPWAALAWLRRRREMPRNAFLLPILFAWTATAAWLGMQALAAPAAVVQPVGLERFLWPAGLALTLLLARHGTQFRVVLFSLALGIVAQRLPAALFSKLASDGGWGTSLDVTPVGSEATALPVNPLTRLQFDPPLVPGSGEQQFWLIWAENVLVYPAFFLLSFVGIAFAAFMLQKHARMVD